MKWKEGKKIYRNFSLSFFFAPTIWHYFIKKSNHVFCFNELFRASMWCYNDYASTSSRIEHRKIYKNTFYVLKENATTQKKKRKRVFLLMLIVLHCISKAHLLSLHTIFFLYLENWIEFFCVLLSLVVNAIVIVCRTVKIPPLLSPLYIVWMRNKVCSHQMPLIIDYDAILYFFSLFFFL